jgi:predicted O-methyltransferase YrrM
MLVAVEKSIMADPDYSRNNQSQVDLVIEALFSTPAQKFLSSAISREEGLFLRSLASRPGVHATIEVGCGNGVSALYICSGIAGKKNASHTAIDPFQSSEFQGLGIENIRRAGFGFFNLIEQASEIALPRLLGTGARFNMALIDGLHTADQTLLDFYFLDRMMDLGGIIVFDDVNSPAVNKIVRYVSTYPNYKLLGTSGHRGIRRRLINSVKKCMAMCLWPVRKVLGDPLCREFWDISVIHSEMLWTIDFCTMAAFQKVSDYDRNTDWYRGI